MKGVLQGLCNVKSKNVTLLTIKGRNFRGKKFLYNLISRILAAKFDFFSFSEKRGSKMGEKLWSK